MRALPSLTFMCMCLPLALSFSTAPPLRRSSVLSSCSMSTAPSRAFLAIGGGAILAGVGNYPVSAASFEEFMAEKRREEARKELLKSGGSAGVGEDDDGDAPTSNVAPSSTDMSATSSRSARDDYKDLAPVVDEDPVKSVMVIILRVQEATLQQERLIRTGQFKDLQRNNIKLATRMILENYGINDAITRASGYATRRDKVSDANDMGKQAIDDLRTIIDYFEDFGSGGNLKVSDMSADKREFLTKALQASRQKLDTFLSYMPTDKVAAARKQVVEENELNQKELPKDMTILNPIFMN